jgi:hypothetical protein
MRHLWPNDRSKTKTKHFQKDIKMDKKLTDSEITIITHECINALRRTLIESVPVETIPQEEMGRVAKTILINFVVYTVWGANQKIKDKHYFKDIETIVNGIKNHSIHTTEEIS